MIFGKYINKYYPKNAPILILGLAALILVDYFQLFIPELYRMVINGMNGDPVLVNGQAAVFDMEFLLDQVCRPMIITIIVMVVGRFLWRVCFFGSAIRVVTDLRTCMFAHSKELSQEYYQVNKVGNLMSLYTNDLDTVQECFGDGILMFCDALFLGLLAVIKMWRMNHFLTGLSMIPMAFLMAAGTTLGKYLMKKWEERQAAFSELSDFAQENYSGLAVIKAFVKETKELMMFRRLNRENEDINVEYTKISTLLNIMVTLFVESVICVILGYGGYLVYCGSFDAGQLVEYIGYFSAVVWPIMAVSMLIEKTSRGKASLNRITELLDAKVDVKDRGGVQDLPFIHGKIEFRNLTFRYPDGEYDVLKNVSFFSVTDDESGNGTMYDSGTLEEDTNGALLGAAASATGYLNAENYLDELLRDYYLHTSSGDYRFALSSYRLYLDGNSSEHSADEMTEGLAKQLWQSISQSNFAVLTLNYMRGEHSFTMRYVARITFSGNRDFRSVDEEDYFTGYEYTFIRPYVYDMEGNSLGALTVSAAKYASLDNNEVLNNVQSARAVQFCIWVV